MPPVPGGCPATVPGPGTTWTATGSPCATCRSTCCRDAGTSPTADGVAAEPEDTEIRAAGAVVWRPGTDGPEVALVHGNRPKTVDYWAAKPADGPQPGFVPNDEVDQVAWLGIPAALDRLSYPHDAGVLDEFAAGPPDTIPFILVRHAS